MEHYNSYKKMYTRFIDELNAHNIKLESIRFFVLCNGSIIDKVDFFSLDTDLRAKLIEEIRSIVGEYWVMYKVVDLVVHYWTIIFTDEKLYTKTTAKEVIIRKELEK